MAQILHMHERCALQLRYKLFYLRLNLLFTHRGKHSAPIVHDMSLVFAYRLSAHSFTLRYRLMAHTRCSRFPTDLQYDPA